MSKVSNNEVPTLPRSNTWNPVVAGPGGQLYYHAPQTYQHASYMMPNGQQPQQMYYGPSYTAAGLAYYQPHPDPYGFGAKAHANKGAGSEAIAPPNPQADTSSGPARPSLKRAKTTSTRFWSTLNKKKGGASSDEGKPTHGSQGSHPPMAPTSTPVAIPYSYPYYNYYYPMGLTNAPPAVAPAAAAAATAPAPNAPAPATEATPVAPPAGDYLAADSISIAPVDFSDPIPDTPDANSDPSQVALPLSPTSPIDSVPMPMPGLDSFLAGMAPQPQEYPNPRASPEANDTNALIRSDSVTDAIKSDPAAYLARLEGPSLSELYAHEAQERANMGIVPLLPIEPPKPRTKRSGSTTSYNTMPTKSQGYRRGSARHGEIGGAGPMPGVARSQSFSYASAPAPASAPSANPSSALFGSADPKHSQHYPTPGPAAQPLPLRRPAQDTLRRPSLTPTLSTGKSISTSVTSPIPTPTSSKFPSNISGGRTPTSQRAGPAVPPIIFDSPTEPFFFLNNASPHKVYFGKKLYPTAEHLFQAFKFLPGKTAMGLKSLGLGALGKGDRVKIAESVRVIGNDARDAWMEGRKNAQFQRKDWDAIKVQKMEQVLYLKFTQHEKLLHDLVATAPAPIIWNSHHDPFWGSGADGHGRNEFGKLLVKLRDKLREEGGL